MIGGFPGETEFYEALANDNRNYIATLTITLADLASTVLTITNSELWENGLSIESAVYDKDAFQIGTAVISKLTITLNNIYDDYTDIDFADARVQVRLGLRDAGGTVRSFIYGYYRVVDFSGQNSSLVTLVCYDGLYRMLKPYSTSTLAYPATLRQIAVDCCTSCNLTLNNPSFYNNSYTVTERPDSDSLTYLDVMAYVAQLAAAYVRCRPSGNVEFFRFDTLNSSYMDITEFIDHSFDLQDVEITGIRVTNTNGVVLDAGEGTTSNEPVSALAGDEGYVIAIEDNPLIVPGQEAICANAIAYHPAGDFAVGFTFRPYSATILSQPTLQAGDCVHLFDPKTRSEIVSYVSSTTFEINGYQRIAMQAESKVRNSLVAYSAMSKTYQKLREMVEVEKTTRELAVESLAHAIEEGGGLYSTIEHPASGGNIYYLHNKEPLSVDEYNHPTFDNDTIVWKMTAEAWAVSTTGGNPDPTTGVAWNGGMEVNGNVIANILSANGVDADWITTGLISDANNQNYWNLDTGDISIKSTAIEAATNMLKGTNPFSTSYWSFPNCDVEYSQTDPFGGTGAVALTSQGNASVNSRVANNSPIISPGTYMLSVWLKAEAERTIILALNHNQGIKKPVTVTTSWRRYDVVCDVSTITSSNQVVIGGWNSFVDETITNRLFVYNPYLYYSDTPEDAFNTLTNNGAIQGIIRDSTTGNLYINASYISTGVLADPGQNMIINLSTGEITMKKGSINLNNGVFAVTSAGALTATNATLSGDVTATSGHIGNWEVSGNTLVGKSQNGDVEVTLSSTNTAPILKVRKNFGYDPDPGSIQVDNWQDVLVVRYTGAIESYARNASGTQTGIFKVDNGNVTASGTFTATNADLTGKVTATEGTIGGLQITQNATRLVGTSSTALTRFFLASQGADNDALLRVQYRNSASDSWTANRKTFEIDYCGRVYMRGKGALSRDYRPMVFDTSGWASITDPTGDVANSGWVYYLSSSSKRYKDVDRDMTAEDVEKYYNIQPVIAKYKDGYLADIDGNVGKYMPMFIAEDVEEYLPEAASHDSEGKTEDWNYRIIVPVMFQMIKSQKETIDKQEKKISDLEERISRLESLLMKGERDG